MFDVYFPGADQVEKLLDVAILPEQFKICLTKISMTLALTAHWIFFGSLHPLTIQFSESLNPPCPYSNVPANTTTTFQQLQSSSYHSLFSDQHYPFQYPRNRVQRPCVGFLIPSSIKHVHGTRFNVPVLDVFLHSFSFNTYPSYSSQYINLYLQRSVTPKFKRASTSPSIFQFSLRFTPKVKQKSSTELSVSFGAFVNYIFRWVVYTYL